MIEKRLKIKPPETRIDKRCKVVSKNASYFVPRGVD